MHNNLIDLIKKAQGKKIMVVGDMVADVYLEGKISRISREAPVLILEHLSDDVVPGGAANTVHNASTLGGQVHAVGIIGDDFAGRELTRILAEKGVDTNCLLTDNNRPTITKTRVMAGGNATVRQQIVRIDRELKEPLLDEVEQKLLECVKKNILDMDAVIISDYGVNTVTPRIRAAIINACEQQRIPCIVDSRYSVMEFQGVTVVKQNESEAAAAIGRKTLDKDGLIEAGETILSQLNAQAVLITLGPDGMMLFERNKQCINIPVTNKSEVYDVTGAGDTVVAGMALALAAGASYSEASRLANFAAGVVVRKPGTATTNLAELVAAIGDHDETDK